MPSSRSYLVTGGGGFLGTALVHRLVAAGHRVRVLDDYSRGSPQRLADLHREIELVRADIRNAEAVEQAAKGVDSVVHLAYVNGTEFFYSRPELVLDIGIRGMLNVIDACRKHAVPELVLASTSEVYQMAPHVPTAEDAPLSIPDVLNARYSYGGGKIACELMAINFGRKYLDRVLIFRPHNVYGPDMGWEHVLPQFVLRALELSKNIVSGPLPFQIQGDGTQTRAFVHIDDFTDGLMLLLERGEHLNIYHIGNPEELTIAEVAAKVARYFGRELRLIPGQAPGGGTQRRCPDISKLRALGYSPRIAFDDGLRSLAQWYAVHAAEAPTAA